MEKEFKLELSIEDVDDNTTVVHLRKEPYMTKDFLKNMLDALWSAKLAESVYYSEELEFNTFPQGAYTIGFIELNIGDDELLHILQGAVGKFLSKSLDTKSLPSDMKLFKAKSEPPENKDTGKTPSPNGQVWQGKDKGWKLNLNQDSLDFLERLRKGSTDTKQSKGKDSLFNFPPDAPVYMQGINICPQVSLQICSEIYLTMYQDYLSAIAIQATGGDCEDPEKIKEAMTQIMNMMYEFKKYIINCEDCKIHDQCDFD
jgi:hypothetical protein